MMMTIMMMMMMMMVVTKMMTNKITVFNGRAFSHDWHEPSLVWKREGRLKSVHNMPNVKVHLLHKRN